MPLPRLVTQRSPLSGLPVPDGLRRGLVRAGWCPDDVVAVRALCGDTAEEVLAAVLRGDFPDQTPPTVLAWLRTGGRPLVDALRDPETRRRQALAMQSWSRTLGELGPYAHAAGLTLQEAVHRLAEGTLTRAALEEQAAGREPAPVLSSWADRLLRPVV